MVLFHFSEDPTITLFQPRLPATHPDLPPLVWAIDEEHAPLYYFPRDCPRAAFQALPHSTAEDVARFLAHTTARRVIAIESRWLEPLRTARLYAYHLPGETFACIDAGAGTYTSRETVRALRVEPVGDLLQRLVAAGVELRITPSLWPLYHALVRSSLQFSIIRMRNAAPDLEAG